MSMVVGWLMRAWGGGEALVGWRWCRLVCSCVLDVVQDGRVVVGRGCVVIVGCC